MAWSIKVEGLGKEYLIRHQQGPRYVALRDVLSDSVRRIFRRASAGGRTPGQVSREHFWALKDVSFEVAQSERVGVIGRNGAGKSTLMKILSRITDPSRGRAIIRGRLASLLEVGTGFHPELTGRENIYLNGAILGMSKNEIRRKFDEIVDFAEIEKFLDTPVKRYSSGMYVRLAFSVAAHLEAELLIVDEVLAVGDAQFQKKCLGRMGEISEGGRTILFVSHNMAAVTSLCNRCILLDQGKAVVDGSPSEVILKYYSSGISSPATFNVDTSNRPIGDRTAQLISGLIRGSSGQPIPEPVIGQSFEISMTYRVLESVSARLVPNFHVYRADGTCAFVLSAPNIRAVQPGEYVASCVVPGNFLNDGAYFVGLALTSFGETGYAVNFFEPSALSINVRDPMDENSNRYGYGGPIPGAVRPMLDWKIERMK